MGLAPIFDVKEKVIGKKGIKAACPYCGGPVIAWDMDVRCSFCFFLLSHKNETQLYCALCSTRLVYSSKKPLSNSP